MLCQTGVLFSHPIEKIILPLAAVNFEENVQHQPQSAKQIECQVRLYPTNVLLCQRH